jgi:integrase
MVAREAVAAKLRPAVPDRYRAIVATAAYTGLRWNAVDLAARRLRVVRVIVEVRGHLSVKPFPKTAAGRRVVPIPRQLVELLAWYRQAFPSPELVFTDTAGGPLRRTGFRTRVWKPAVRRSGLPERLRFHDLRHSFATWLVSDGVPPNIVQATMGHEQTSTTLDRYTHPSQDRDSRVRLAFADFTLTPASEPVPKTDEETDNVGS